ncbi:MAG: flagellin [Alphaproteobacteria bacterium]|nr:flagellin [Alphaproteobacteria bacterium]
MALNVISNFAANVAHRNLTRSDAEMTDSLSKLSSGTRVVSAKDDAASMAIGSRLSAEINALRQAQVNAGQAVSMLQVADGAMSRAHDILLRMKTLAVQAGSGQLSGTERGMLNTEYGQLVSEIDRLAFDTEFNGNQLVNGSIGVATNTTGTAPDFEPVDGMQAISFIGAFDSSTNGTISYDAGSETFTVSAVEAGNSVATSFTGGISSDIHDGSTMSTGTVVSLTASGTSAKIDLLVNTLWDVDGVPADGTLGLSGASTTDFTYKVGTGTSPTADEISVTLTSISAAALGLDTTDVLDTTNSDAASLAISSAVDALNVARANIGASQNRLEFAAANIATTLENTEAARSNLLDLDIAAEMSRLTSKQILVQAGVAMLAQANQTPETLLRLFQ